MEDRAAVPALANQADPVVFVQSLLPQEMSGPGSPFGDPITYVRQGLALNGQFFAIVGAHVPMPQQLAAEGVTPEDYYRRIDYYLRTDRTKRPSAYADFLTDDEWDRHRQNYHVLLAQAGISEAGPRLAQAILKAQRTRHYPGWPRALQSLRAWYEKERMLSMLTMFLGVASMRDLGLPLRPPWAFNAA